MIPLLRKTSMLVLACLWCASAFAQLPAPVKPGHPRLFTTQADIENLKSKIPLGPETFPADGATLEFDILPRRKGAQDPTDLAVFGEFNSSRNGVFIRHVDSWDDDTRGTTGFQLALQANGKSHYIAHVRMNLATDQWSHVKLGWNSDTHTVTVRQNDTPLPISWYQTNGVPADWEADGQRFQFRGRKGEEIKNFRLTTASQQVVIFYPAVDIALGLAWEDYLALVNWRRATLATCQTTPTPSEKPEVCNVATGHRILIHDVARDLALAYRITRQEQYLESAKDYIRKMMAVPLTAGKEWSMGGRVAAMGILYDWLFAELSGAPVPNDPEQRTYRVALAQTIKKTIAATSANRSEDLDVSICGNQPALTNTSTRFDCQVKPVYENWDRYGSPLQPSIAHTYIGGHNFSAVNAIVEGLLAIAEEHPEVLPMLETAYSHFDKGFLAARAIISIDGGHHMGYAYGVSSIPERVLMWRTALQSPATPIFQADWQSKLIYPYIYALRGDKSFPASGDTFDTQLGESTIAQLALWAASNARDTTAWSFYQQHILPARTSRGNLVLERLFWPISLAETPVTQLELSRHFRTSGQVLMRDSWDFANASLLEFKSTSFSSENHQHLDQNSFSLYYKAPLLLDSGAYDAYESSHWSHYYTRSIAHNTITVFDPSERFMKGSREFSNDGGQWFPDPNTRYPTLEEIRPGAVNHLEGITAYENTPAYTFTAGNASKAYSQAKMNQADGFVRRVLFLRTPTFWPKPVFVVFDSVRSERNLPATFLLHTAQDPAASAAATHLGSGQYQLGFASGAPRTLTIRNGGGMVTVQTLLPVNAKVLKVGGKDQAGATCDQVEPSSAGDCRFTSRERQPDGSFVWRNYPVLPVAHSHQTDLGAWRLEVTAPSAPTGGATQYFLHVFSIANNDGASGLASAPSATRLASDANTEAMLLGGKLVVAFHRQTAPAASLSWTSPVPSSGIIATGMKPNTNFARTVLQVGSMFETRLVEAPASSTTYRSSPQGVVNIP